MRNGCVWGILCARFGKAKRCTHEDRPVTKPRGDGCNEPAGFIDLETGAFLDGCMGRGVLA